jgi:hypothetical protein
MQIDYAKVFSRSHDAVIRVYDEAGNVIDTHDHAREFVVPQLEIYSALLRSLPR